MPTSFQLPSPLAKQRAAVGLLLRDAMACSLPAALVLTTLLSLPLAAVHAAPSQKKTSSAKKVDPRSKDPGERAFQANCSRCHNPPDSLSPSISGTVLRHMRVRANLSAEDERLILEYLNP